MEYYDEGIDIFFLSFFFVSVNLEQRYLTIPRWIDEISERDCSKTRYRANIVTYGAA